MKGGVLSSLLKSGEVFDCMGILTEAEGTNKVHGWKKKKNGVMRKGLTKFTVGQKNRFVQLSLELHKNVKNALKC